MDKLRFKARGTALVQNFERLEAGTNAFVGRRYVGMLVDGVERFAWAPTSEAAEVPHRAEYLKACKDGDLWAADSATAAACGVPFDPYFGERPAPADQSNFHFEEPAPEPDTH